MTYTAVHGATRYEIAGALRRHFDGRRCGTDDDNFAEADLRDRNSVGSLRADENQFRALMHFERYRSRREREVFRVNHGGLFARHNRSGEGRCQAER